MITLSLRRNFIRLLALFFVLALGLSAGETATTFPLDQVHPGLKGVAYTIFSGDEVEKVDLVVLGVLHDALGPKQDVILVQLLGEKAEHSGVVAGMSGSPVYFDGKLAGALSLKLGVFTKEAIGGVTPIQGMLDVERDAANPKQTDTIRNSPSAVNTGTFPPASRVALPQEFSSRTGAGAGQFLVPIETPLISAGLYPDTIAQFSKQISGWGMSMVAGGNAEPSPEDANLKPGDMVGVELIRGDLSIAPGCTVTAVESDGTVLACGHPIFSFGSVSMPMTRGHVVTTLASAMASTKIMTSGATIGTLTQDRTTAIMGKLGAGPPMIPVDVTLTMPNIEKKFHFEVIESPQLTPLLVALATYNGITGSPAYGEGWTLRLDGDIELKGHTPVHLENLFAPNDAPIPSGFFVANEVQGIFARIYSNPYERAHVDGVHIKVTALAERRWSMIDNAWTEKSEVTPGQTVAVKVLLRPYRGEPFIQEIPITIPPQTARGTLQLLISDGETLDRTVDPMATMQGPLPGLEELIRLINRGRQNDCLYATLLQPTTTLLVEDKVMPNAPSSEINVLDQRQSVGGARLLHQSLAGSWFAEMHQVITGERTLTIIVK
jgi:hypothetical protein